MRAVRLDILLQAAVYCF